MKYYSVEIELDSFEINVKAKNETDARMKAVARLKKKNPINLIRREWDSKKRIIWIDER